MNSSRLKDQVIDLVEIEASLEELISIVRTFKEAGGSREDAYAILQQARFEVDDRKEDRLLELMDFVSGYCSPEKRLW
jgi:hypothetical protein